MGAVIAALAVVAACGSDNSGSSSATSAATASTAGGSASTARSPATSGAAATTAAAKNVDANATLTTSTTQWDSFDPAATTVASLTGRWLSPVSDLLVTQQPDGSFAPGLATSWEFTKDGAGDNLVLHLRQGVKFHDGTAFDAAAVKANFDRNLASTKNIQTLIRTIQGATVVDPMTVSLQLKPGQGWLALWQLTMLPGRMFSPTAFDQIATHPVGTGPFVFKSMTPTTAMFVRNDNYWGDKPQYTKLVLQVVGSDNTASINGIISGDLDIMSIVGATDAELSQVKNAPGLKVEPAPSAQFTFLSLDRSKAPFDNPMVRQAVAYALDYDAITKALKYAPTRQPVGPKSKVYDPARDTHHTHDVNKAKQLLAQAGYPNGVDAGSIVTNVTGSSPKLAQIAQQQLGAIGIKLQVHQVESAAQLTEVCNSGGCNMVSWALIQGQDPVYLTELMLLPPVNPSNPGGKATTGEIGTLLQQAEQPAEPDPHNAVVNQLLNSMTDQAISVYTGVDLHYVVYKDKVLHPLDGWANERYPGYAKLAIAAG
jgi:peptide/nickel transport system substrate-binding protein